MHCITTSVLNTVHVTDSILPAYPANSHVKFTFCSSIDTKFTVEFTLFSIHFSIVPKATFIPVFDLEYIGYIN